MLIRKVHIENFKRWETLDAELKPLDCLVGPTTAARPLSCRHWRFLTSASITASVEGTAASRSNGVQFLQRTFTSSRARTRLTSGPTEKRRLPASTRSSRYKPFSTTNWRLPSRSTSPTIVMAFRCPAQTNHLTPFSSFGNCASRTCPCSRHSWLRRSARLQRS